MALFLMTISSYIFPDVKAILSPIPLKLNTLDGSSAHETIAYPPDVTILTTKLEVEKNFSLNFSLKIDNNCSVAGLG